MIYIREITESDMSKINTYRNNKELMENLVGAFRFVNMETDQKWFQNYMNQRANNVRCAICLADTHELIGVVYLLDINWVYRTANYGIFIGEEDQRGKCYGEIATRMILNHGFGTLNLNRIDMRVLEENERAIGLYKKIGFQKEGILREAVYKNGHYQNLMLMSLLHREYIMMDEKDLETFVKRG